MGSAVVTLLQDSKFNASDRVTDYGDRIWGQEAFKASVQAAESNRHWRARLSNEDGIMTSKSIPGRWGGEDLPFCSGNDMSERDALEFVGRARARLALLGELSAANLLDTLEAELRGDYRRSQPQDDFVLIPDAWRMRLHQVMFPNRW